MTLQLNAESPYSGCDVIENPDRLIESKIESKTESNFKPKLILDIVDYPSFIRPISFEESERIKNVLKEIEKYIKENDIHVKFC